MRSILPYAHYPREKQGSTASSVTVRHLQDDTLVSVPGARRFPRSALTAGAALLDVITTLAGMAVFCALAWFFLVLS